MNTLLAVALWLISRAASERQRRAEAARVAALDEVGRAARAEAYIVAFDAAVKRYERSISAYHERHRMVPSPERDAIACAQGDLDRLRDAWAEDRPER